MLKRPAYGLVTLISLTGCHAMRDMRPNQAEPAYQQYVAGATAVGVVDSDATALTATSNRIDQVAASAASGSPQSRSNGESEVSSRQASKAARQSQSSACSSGCCSN